MVILTFGTGLRRGELAGLTGKTSTLKRRNCYLQRSIVAQPVGRVKTEASGKKIPLDDALIENLLD